MALVLSENFRALFYAPFYAAHAIGAYAAEGVDVVLRASPDPATTARALREGSADLMWGGPLRVILSRAENPASDLVGFCDVVRRDPFFIIGSTPRPDFSLSDMAHLRLATVSEVPTPWLCLQDDFRRAGLDPASLSLTTGRGMAENAAALRRGEVDAVQIFQPYVEELIAAGHGHVWYAQASRGPTAYTMLVTRRPVLEARRDEFLLVTRAMARTLRWFAATPAAEIARALAEFFPDVTTPVFAAAIDRYRALQLWCTDPRPNREGFERLHAAMHSGGVLHRNIRYEDCIETGLADVSLAGGSRDL